MYNNCDVVQLSPRVLTDPNKELETVVLWNSGVHYRASYPLLNWVRLYPYAYLGERVDIRSYY